MTRILLAVAASAAFVYCLMPIFRAIALTLNVVDVPGPRSVHKIATPRFGGAAIFIGFLLGAALYSKAMPEIVPVIVAACIIFVLGLIDDMRRLGAGVRIVVQSLAVAVLIISGIRVNFLPQGALFNAAEILITWIWLVGVMNAFNYLDGLDGLAAGSAIINLICFGVILYASGQIVLLCYCAILMAACIGFLPYNFRKQKMFLGDAGSTFLGFMLATIALVGNWAQESMVKLSIPILILGVPIFDMIFTTIMRVREEKVKTIVEWLRYGGRDHFHHYLVDIGLLPHGAVGFIYCITFSLGISAVMVSNDHSAEAVLALSQAGIIFGVIAALIVAGKRRRHG